MTRLYHKWLIMPKAVRWPLVILFYLSLISTYVLWQNQRSGGVYLYGHNHTDRPIFSYWVDDNWGGNGGVTCCWRIRGETLRVVWIVSRTRAQAEQGMEEGRHEVELPNPPRERDDLYLHVHFFPGNQVRLAWAPGHGTPYAGFKEAPVAGIAP